MDQNEIPHDPRHVGVPSGASEMIYEPVQHSAQIMHISCIKISTIDRGGVPDLSVSGDNFHLVVVDPHDPTMTSEPEVPMQSLNQLPMVTNLAGMRSA
jgi:hypothetical protein